MFSNLHFIHILDSFNTISCYSTIITSYHSNCYHIIKFRMILFPFIFPFWHHLEVTLISSSCYTSTHIHTHTQYTHRIFSVLSLSPSNLISPIRLLYCSPISYYIMFYFTHVKPFYFSRFFSNFYISFQFISIFFNLFYLFRFTDVWLTTSWVSSI